MAGYYYCSTECDGLFGPLLGGKNMHTGRARHCGITFSHLLSRAFERHFVGRRTDIYKHKNRKGEEVHRHLNLVSTCGFRAKNAEVMRHMHIIHDALAFVHS